MSGLPGVLTRRLHGAFALTKPVSDPYADTSSNTHGHFRPTLVTDSRLRGVGGALSLDAARQRRNHFRRIGVRIQS